MMILKERLIEAVFEGFILFNGIFCDIFCAFLCRRALVRHLLRNIAKPISNSDYFLNLFNNDSSNEWRYD